MKEIVMNIIISCLIFLLGSIENGLCMETPEVKEESFVNKICRTFDPREYPSSTRYKLLVTTVAVTGAVTALVYYCTLPENEEASYLLNTQNHASAAEFGSHNLKVIHEMLTQGLSFLTNSLTGQVYKLQLVSSELLFPKGDYAISQAGFMSIPPNPEDVVFGRLLDDLNTTFGGPCFSNLQKFLGLANPCHSYSWDVSNISCVCNSFFESTCNVAYAATNNIYSSLIRSGGSVFPARDSPILQVLKGIIGMEWKITNE